MTDLKPCPHCGSHEVSGGYALVSECYWFCCESCGMRGPIAATAELAQQRWNGLSRTRWVSVDERLPPHLQMVAVKGPALAHPNHLPVAWYDEQRQCFMKKWPDLPDPEPLGLVTCWLDDLPEVPPEAIEPPPLASTSQN